VASGGEITVLLTAMKGGDPNAETRLVGLVYDDLHALARRYMSRERPDHTLQPTALVHETYLRLISDSAIDWKNRAHFFATAATVMRRILVDTARARGAGKRGGGAVRLDLNESIDALPGPDHRLVELDEALESLARFDARKAKVVELRFFGGLSVEETAAVLGLSPQSVMRAWKLARAWLMHELSR